MVNMMLPTMIKQYIVSFYNKFSSNIITIYLTGSRLFSLFNDSAHDYDIFLLTDTEDTKNTIISYLDGHEVILAGYKIDFRIWSMSELEKYWQKDLIMWYDYQFYFMNLASPIIGKKFKFVNKMAINKKQYIKTILSMTEDAYFRGYINKYNPEYFEVKMLYHMLFAYYILLNKSYTDFSNEQIEILKKAKECKFLTNDVVDYLTKVVNPTLHKMLLEVN